MELLTVKKGIYCLGDVSERSFGQPVVAVHPYFKLWHPDLVEPEDLHDGYIERYDRFFGSHEGPIITLGERRGFERTIERYKSIGIKSGRYMIRTKNESQDLSQITFQDFLDFLRSFRTSPIGLAGGYLCSWGGCLALMEKGLEDCGLETEIKDGLFFS